jgi:hypothetical protein
MVRGGGGCKWPAVVAVVAAAAAVSLLLPSSGSGQGAHAAWKIGRIHAEFSEASRATTYTVIDVEDPPAGGTTTFAWTLSLEPVDPDVDVNGLSVDANCDNRGALTGSGPSFVWHHGNKGDPVSDDGCDHDLQGKYGHQGLITLAVADGLGTTCTTIYKGTLSSEVALSAGLDVNAEPVCTGLDSPPPPPPPPPSPPPAKRCKCILLTVRILPKSLHLVEVKPDGVSIAFDVHWVMTCLKTPGSKPCAGSLVLVAPRGPSYATSFNEDEPVLTQHVTCKGACGQANDGSAVAILDSLPAKGLGPKERAKLGRIPIVVRRTCNSKTLAPIKLSIAFGKRGKIDLKKSKLR